MKLKLPEGSFGAYLFDCDGTIVDSMPLHYLAWKKALGEWNCEFSEEQFYAWGGMPVAEVISTLNRDRGLHMPVDELEHRKESLYFELLPQLKAVPEVLEHIEAQHGRIPFGVVSGSKRDSVTASRDGGAIHFPSGHVTNFLHMGQGLPEVGSQYVLFLWRSIPNLPEYEIIINSGYQLKDGRAYALDDTNSGYDNSDANVLIGKIQTAIAGGEKP